MLDQTALTHLKKLYKKPRRERLEALQAAGLLSSEDVLLLQQNTPDENLGETMVENFMGDFHLPQGLGLNLVVNDESFVVPMVTEEPSVIAAASHGAGIVKRAGGFVATMKARMMVGQILLADVDVAAFAKWVAQNEKGIIKTANDAHPSIVKRGGGAQSVRVRQLGADKASLDILIDVKKAMGANMVNTMCEAVARLLSKNHFDKVVMAILSNYATTSVVEVSCRIPVGLLAKNGVSGATYAKKIAQASQLAQIDVYRATTHNKGIMNGIDAAVIASGNDWRAVEAAAHAYAARDGQYRGLSTWEVDDATLVGKIALPMALGTVGGSIKLVPQVQLNQKILGCADPKKLAQVIAAVGLAQNLAALYALVSDGIQKGHMKLQLKTLAATLGATPKEIAPLVARMEQLHKTDSKTARKQLKEIRRQMR